MPALALLPKSLRMELSSSPPAATDRKSLEGDVPALVLLPKSLRMELSFEFSRHVVAPIADMP